MIVVCGVFVLADVKSSAAADGLSAIYLGTGVFDTKNTFFEPTAHRCHEDS